MYYLLIYRSTDGCRKRVSILIRESFKSWSCPIISNEFFSNFIQLTCSYTRLHHFSNLS